jgi:hypothetical protein
MQHTMKKSTFHKRARTEQAVGIMVSSVATECQRGAAKLTQNAQHAGQETYCASGAPDLIVT